MRRDDWYPRLMLEISRARWRAFEYGRFDCVHWIARCVDVQTGSTWEASLPAYASHLGAWRVLVREGCLERAISARLGPAQSPARAVIGDPCLVRWYARHVAGIRYEDAVLVPGFAGLEPLPLRYALRCWNI